MPLVALPCGSPSTNRVRFSAAARLAARFTAVVVLPTPPFWLAIAITRATSAIFRELSRDGRPFFAARATIYPSPDSSTMCHVAHSTLFRPRYKRPAGRESLADDLLARLNRRRDGACSRNLKHRTRRD